MFFYAAPVQPLPNSQRACSMVNNATSLVAKEMSAARCSCHAKLHTSMLSALCVPTPVSPKFLHLFLHPVSAQKAFSVSLPQLSSIHST